MATESSKNNPKMFMTDERNRNQGALIALVLGAMVFVGGGCGGRLDQVMQLDRFELPNGRPKSDMYRRLLDAYYRADPAGATSEELARADAFDPATLRDDQGVWVREMYEIQSIDRGERIFGSRTMVETWSALTPRARLALMPWLN